jgi:hypothetical protein
MEKHQPRNIDHQIRINLYANPKYSITARFIPHMLTMGAMAYAEQASRSTYGSIPSGDSAGNDPTNSLHRRSNSGLGESVRLIVNSSFVFDGEACSVRDMGGHATIPSEVANIAKNLIGGGVLSLSGGMAIYSDNPAAVWSATLWIAVLGCIFGYFCLLIAKVRVNDRERNVSIHQPIL